MTTILKRFIIRFLARYGYEFARVKPRLPGNAAGDSIDVLSVLVREASAKKKDFSFVQVGANDGVMYDPIKHLVESSWRGLLIEPNPVPFKELQQAYRTFPKCICLQVAIIEGPKRTVSLYSAPSSGELSVRASLNKSIAEVGLSDSGEKAVALEVPGADLESLFSEHSVRELDLFVTDTEGYDYIIMRQLLRSPVLAGIIQFEHYFMSPAEHSEICQHLLDKGYRILTINNDTIARRKES